MLETQLVITDIGKISATFPPGEVTEIRHRLLDLTGFDLFTSPRFIESFVCGICSLQQTNKQANCDAVTAAYERVEIKQLADKMRPQLTGGIE